MAGREPFSTHSGLVAPLRRNHVDTDQIIPKQFLKRIERSGFGPFLFSDWKRDPAFVLNQPPYAGASILAAGVNFGCGSSREHAPQGLKRWGIRAVIGESFSEIFFGNAVMIGMPCVTASLSDLNALMADVEQHPKVRLKLDLANGTCQTDGVFCQVSLPDSARDAFITGAWDTTGLLRERYDEVNAAASRLPYISGFRT